MTVQITVVHNYNVLWMFAAVSFRDKDVGHIKAVLVIKPAYNTSYIA